MQRPKHLGKSLFGRAALAAGALAGMLCFARTASAQAREWRDERGPVVRIEERHFRGPVVGGGFSRYRAPAPVYGRFDNCWRDQYGRLHRY